MGKGKHSQERWEMAVRLRAIRKRCDKTQGEMAGVLGISLSGYKKLENGKNQISVGNLKKLCQQVETSTDYILFGDSRDRSTLWNTIEKCSEEDKRELLLRLMLHFVEVGRKLEE